MGQSPIALYESDALALKDAGDLFQIFYPKGRYPGKFVTSKGHTNFEFNPPTGAFPEVRFRQTEYQLAKIHLHHPPEHIVGEEAAADFEIHLIHVPKGGSAPSPLVVIGILYSLSHSAKGNDAFQCLCQSTDIDPLDFFPLVKGKPDLKHWYHYEGSLTSFPYSENVSWFVMDKRGDVTKDEVAELQKYATQHAREVQPLDRRLIVRSF